MSNALLLDILISNPGNYPDKSRKYLYPADSSKSNQKVNMKTSFPGQHDQVFYSRTSSGQYGPNKLATNLKEITL
jgi:hypothetical protein